MTNSIPEKPDVVMTGSEASQPKKGFGVAASPFNGIKLELGICVVLGVLLVLGAEFITADEGAQLMILLAYSLLSASWLVVRTRAVLRRCESGRSSS